MTRLAATVQRERNARRPVGVDPAAGTISERTTANPLRRLVLTWWGVVFCSGVPLTFLDLSALIQQTEHRIGVDVITSGFGDVIRVASVRYVVFGAGVFVGALALRGLASPSWSVSPWLAAYAGWASVSVAWAGNPILAAVKVISLWSAILVAAALRARAGQSSLVVVTFMQAATAVLLSAVVVAFVVPEFGIMGSLDRYARLGGEYVHPNTLGQYAGMLLVLLWSWPTGWRKWVLVSLQSSSVVVLLLTQSRTSLAAAVAALVMVKWLRAHRASRAALVGVAAMLVLGLAIGDLGLGRVAGLFGRGSAEELNDMVTIRADVWKEALERGADRPLIGHGFATGSRLALGAQRMRSGHAWQPMHSHNALVETYLNLGVVGVVLLVIAIGSIAVGLGRTMRMGAGWRPRATSAAGLLTFVLVVGLSESSYAGELGQAFVGLLVCAVVGGDLQRPPARTVEWDAESSRPS